MVGDGVEEEVDDVDVDDCFAERIRKGSGVDVNLLR